MKLTVVIPTLNEEKDLPRTLKSLSKLTKNLLLVDSGSTDKTIAIARQYGAKVIHHPFKSFSDTRNFADRHVRDGWILSLEADVLVPQKLAQEIHQVITSNSHISAYFIPRINIIWGKKITHTDWGPKDDLHIWLYRKGSGSWQNKLHEEYHLRNGVTGKLTHSLIHYNYQTIHEFIHKINSYSELAKTNNQDFPVYWPFRNFLKRFVYKQGFLDGYHGLFLSYLQAVYFNVLKIKHHQFKHV